VQRGRYWNSTAAITVITGGLYISTGFGYLFGFAFCILFAPLLATGCILGSCMIVMALWGLLGPPELGASSTSAPECVTSLRFL
jgi:hypothetical protein